MHIRQIALVAQPLEPLVSDLCSVFDLQVPFRDEGVGQFGLSNAVMAVGDTFLEVVSPERPGTTAGRFLERRGGDGGYMVILQTRDLESDRTRLDRLGVRIVWQIQLDDIATVHLHPRDVGGTIVSLDQPEPPESWRWGGPDWQTRPRSQVLSAITGATLEAHEPLAMAERWSKVLDRPLDQREGSPTVTLEPGSLRFVRAAGRGEGLAAVRVECLDAARALNAARGRGLATEASRIQAGGVWFELA